MFVGVCVWEGLGKKDIRRNLIMRSFAQCTVSETNFVIFKKLKVHIQNFFSRETFTSRSETKWTRNGIVLRNWCVKVDKNDVSSR